MNWKRQERRTASAGRSGVLCQSDTPQKQFSKPYQMISKNYEILTGDSALEGEHLHRIWTQMNHIWMPSDQGLEKVRFCPEVNQPLFKHEIGSKPNQTKSGSRETLWSPSLTREGGNMKRSAQKDPWTRGHCRITKEG